MSKIKQSHSEIIEHLNEQMNFLKSSCQAFDFGNIAEGKRIALALRILLHDTKNSTSLLSQLKLKDKIKFLNSAYNYDSNNLFAYHGLVGLRISSDDRGNRFFPLLESSKKKMKLQFTDWWDKPVIKDTLNVFFTRKDIVLNIANTDGGAHIDPKLNEDYSNLSRTNTIGWKSIDSGGVESELIGVKLASVRQIAYEVFKTLDKYTKK